MKKTLIILLFLAIYPAILLGQPSKGNLWLSGSASFMNRSTTTRIGGTTFDGPVRTQFTVMPAVGVFLGGNRLLGTSLSFSNVINRERAEDGQIRISHPMFVFSPFLRYYRGINENFLLHAELFARAGFGAIKGEIEVDGQSDGSSTSVNTMGLGGRAGISWHLSPRMALEVKVGVISLDHFSYQDENQVKDQTVAFEFLLQPASVNFALSILF